MYLFYFIYFSEEDYRVNYPSWKTRKVTHILDTPENYVRLTDCILHNSRMSIFPEELPRRPRDSNKTPESPSNAPAPTVAITESAKSTPEDIKPPRKVEVEKTKTVSVKFSDLHSKENVGVIDTKLFPPEEITKSLMTSPIGNAFIAQDGDQLALRLNRDPIDEVLKSTGCELRGAEVKFEVTYVSKKPLRACANCDMEEPKPKTYKKCQM